MTESATNLNLQDWRIPPPTSGYFQGRVAVDESERRALFALRYEVFCRERGFLDSRLYPDGQESDDWDKDAIHIGLYKNDDNALIAGARLIIIGEEGSPLVNRCNLSADFAPPLNGQAVEISRLVIAAKVRRRRNDGPFGDAGQNPHGPHHRNFQAPDNVVPLHEKRQFKPLILMALYREIYRVCKDRGIAFWYACMEPSLCRLMARSHIDFERIGEEIDYFGPVAPYRLCIKDAEARMAERNQKIYAAFTAAPRDRSESLYSLE